MAKRSYTDFVIPVLVTLALLGVGFGSWMGGTGGGRKAQKVELPVPAGCDPVHAPCVAHSSDLALRLTLGPPVVVLQRFPVVVELDGSAALDARSVEVTFVMHGMDMGQNRYQLTAEQPGRWTGQAMLPVCASGRTDWLATVTVDGPAGRRDAVFPFKAEKH